MKSLDYVVGFLFSTNRCNVVLIRKNKPKWQEGKYNGVGGKVEAGETFHAAMVREFEEETGAVVPAWNLYCTLMVPEHNDKPPVRIDFFRAFSDAKIASVTDEDVSWCSVYDLPGNAIPNLHWLIPMALHIDDDACDYFVLMEKDGVKHGDNTNK